MEHKIELLAPGGDVKSIKAAIIAGADAVYCGLEKFNARNRAANITFAELQGIIRLAHSHNCKVFLTLNIILLDSEMPALFNLLNKLVNTSIDGVIIQDFVLFYLLSKYFKTLKIHASTQLTTHNSGQIQFFSKLNATRVNLSRELSIHEIKALSKIALKHNVLTEVFVQGSYCISFSGLCYMSSVHGGNSGNRGRCSQPCRDIYQTSTALKNYPLNLKDNSAFLDLKDLVEAGVYSLKIEGRIKQFDYVYTVVDLWKNQIRNFVANKAMRTTLEDFYKVFNRDFSNAYLKGELQKNMFIDHPRDHSIQHISSINNFTSDKEKEEAHLRFYSEKEANKLSLEKRLNKISIDKPALSLIVSGEQGTSLTIEVKSTDFSYSVVSETKLVDKGTQQIDEREILKRFKAINETEYSIEHIDITQLKAPVYLPFNELTALKNKVLYFLNNSTEIIDSIAVPVIKSENKCTRRPTLNVLISSIEELENCKNASGSIYFELPNDFKNECHKLILLFQENRQLRPWFPAVLIGDDYTAALEFLSTIKPECIVTNNTGIAYEASNMKIKWIAGPYLNLVNSFSLLCLKENFNCAGAFISNEISKSQLSGIKKPTDFELFYSICHPITLLSSRQCLFHQIEACEKQCIDAECISNCEKTSVISKNNTRFIVEKKKGYYHRIFNDINYLNLEVRDDFTELFSGYFIEITELENDTKVQVNTAQFIQLFENFIDGKPEAIEKLQQVIYPTTYNQYKVGI